MNAQPDGLISVLLDKTAREDERDDAAMDLGSYPTNDAIEALFRIASDTTENSTVLDSCGESLAEIWVERNQLEKDKISKLSSISFRAAKHYIKQYKSEWLNYFD